jgi:hypothetical protein
MLPAPTVKWMTTHPSPRSLESTCNAATLATGNIVRAAFCSVDCLAEKLGFKQDPPRE